jgi:hypothetical protein
MLRQAEKFREQLNDPALQDAMKRAAEAQSQIERQLSEPAVRNLIKRAAEAQEQLRGSGVQDALKQLEGIEKRMTGPPIPNQLGVEMRSPVKVFDSQIEQLRATRQLGESIEDMADDMREDIGILVAVARAQLAGLTDVAAETRAVVEASKATQAETVELRKLVKAADHSARKSQRWMIALTFLVLVLASLTLFAQLRPALMPAPATTNQSASPTSASPSP